MDCVYGFEQVIAVGFNGFFGNAAFVFLTFRLFVQLQEFAAEFAAVNLESFSE